MRPTGEAGRFPTGALRRLNFNCIAAAAFVGLGVALVLLIPSQIEKPLLILGQGSDGLDPALFPSVVAGALIVIGLWFLAAAFAMREVNGLRELDWEAWQNVGVSLVAFLAYALLMEPLGFVLSSVLLIGALSLFYGAGTCASSSRSPSGCPSPSTTPSPPR